MRLFTIIMVISVVLTAFDVSLGQQTPDKKNPFGSLGKPAAQKKAATEDNPPVISDTEQPIRTEVFSLEFANAKDMEKVVNTLISSDGKVGIDERLNCIVVTDTAANLQRIGQILKKLDTKAPEVMITEVFNLSFANAKDVEKTINRFVSSDGNVVIDEGLHSIIVTDTAANLERIDQVLKKLDTETPEVMISKVFNLNFANAKDVEETINKLISSNGKVGIDERLNSVVITDTPENLERISKAIQKLDTQAPQVMIEALIINVKLTDELKMGVDWIKLGTSENYLSQGLSVTGSASPFGKVTFLATPSNWSIQGLIDFVETNKDVRILANPKVLVLNNHTATIDSVEEIPYKELSETSEGGSIGTISFKEAGIKLEVTPQITDDGYIIMHVKPEQSAQTSTFTIENSETPVIETRRTDTTLCVKDGQTIIIGGLRERRPSVQESKVPILGDVPFIGVLFRRVDTDLIESELGVFITPHIYTDGKLSDEELKLIEEGEKSKSLYEASDLLRLQPNDDIKR